MRYPPEEQLRHVHTFATASVFEGSSLVPSDVHSLSLSPLLCIAEYERMHNAQEMC